MIFNEHIIKELRNEFKGSERKKTILLDDGEKYLLKFPDPSREKKVLLSYINNSVSEYIGCKIAKSMDLPVQKVILGKYFIDGKTKIACACQDVRKPNEKMIEVDTLELSEIESHSSSKEIDIESINELLDRIGITNTKEFYYDMFFLDALIGNTDRHNGNWAILVDDKGNERISPIYDCGSCLYPLFSDEQLESANIQALALSVHSVIHEKKNASRIKYHDYLLGCKNEYVNEAILRNIGKINMNEINKIIDEIPYISDTRKNFYKSILQINFEKTFIPVLEKLITPELQNKYKEEDLYDWYKTNIQPLKEIPLFENRSVMLFNRPFLVRRISNKNLMLLNCNKKPIGIISIRSNNKDVRKTKETLELLIEREKPLAIPQKCLDKMEDGKRNPVNKHIERDEWER